MSARLGPPPSTPAPLPHAWSLHPNPLSPLRAHSPPSSTPQPSLGHSLSCLRPGLPRRPGLHPQSHTWPYCSRTPSPPRLGRVPPVSVCGATPRPRGKAPAHPRPPLCRAVRKGRSVQGPGAVVRAGGAWFPGGSGCAEPTGTSAAGRVIHASRCRCRYCEVSLSPPPWPIVCGGWRHLSESSWQQLHPRVLGTLLAAGFTG